MLHRSFFPRAMAFACALSLPLVATAEPSEELTAELMPAIETGLASEDVAVRSWAIQAAALLQGDDATDALVADLENVNMPVQLAAARALIGLGEEEDEAEATLVRAILEGDAQTRGLVLGNILFQVGEDVRLSVLRDALSQVSDATVHRVLVDHIAQRGEGDLYALLFRVSDIDDAETRAIYTSAVTRAGRAEGVAIARELLDARDQARQLEGAEIAFALNTIEARELLQPLLDDSDPAIAQRAGFHLAQYGDAEALGLARDLVLNPEMPEDLRLRAMALVRTHGAQLVSFEQCMAMLDETGRSLEFRTDVHKLIGATRSPEAIAHLRGLLDGLFADERMLGIAGIGYTGQSDASQTLQEILGGAGDQMLRLAAADALGHLGGDLAAQALIDALRGERVLEVKIAIVEALGNTGSGLATQPIANALAMQDADLAHVALNALKEIGDAAIASQVESAAITFRDRGIRWQATIVLTHLDANMGRIRLLQALDRPPETFMSDISALPQDIRDAVDERLLQHADPTIRESALLRVIRRPDGGYAVLRPFAAAGTPDVRRQAISVVTASGLADDAEIFTELSQDTDRSIRLQGFAALAELGDAENEELFRAYLNHADVALRLIATYALIKMA